MINSTAILVIFRSGNIGMYSYLELTVLCLVIFGLGYWFRCLQEILGWGKR